MSEDATPQVCADPIVVTRDLDVDVPVDELWGLVADGERWTEWLGESADIIVEPERRGSLRDDDGVERDVAIRTVVPGERVTFAWWPTDRPEEASTVELVVAPLPWVDGDRSRLSIVETYMRPGASVVAATGRRWDVRLMLFALRLDAVSLARRS